MNNFFTIIGGMGTLATEYFIKILNKRTIIKSDQDFFNYIVVNHATIPDRTNFILNNRNFNPLLKVIIDIKQQQILKPNFIVIPCNTMHFFLNSLQKQTKIPILNMIKETINYIKKKFPIKNKNNINIFFLGTKGSIKTNLYIKELKKLGYNPKIPNKNLQNLINDLIFKNIKYKKFLNIKLFLKIISIIKNKNCKIIILGCTELSIIKENLKQKIKNINLIDTQSILINKTIKLALKFKKGI